MFLNHINWLWVGLWPALTSQCQSSPLWHGQTNLSLHHTHPELFTLRRAGKSTIELWLGFPGSDAGAAVSPDWGSGFLSKLQERAGLCFLHLLLPPQGCAAGLGEASETPGCAGAPVGPLWLKTRAGSPNTEMMESWLCLTPHPSPPSPRGQWLAGLTHPWVLLNKTFQLQSKSGSGAGPGVLELQGSSWPAFPAAAQCQAIVPVELCEVQQGKERGVVPWCCCPWAWAVDEQICPVCSWCQEQVRLCPGFLWPQRCFAMRSQLSWGTAVLLGLASLVTQLCPSWCSCNSCKGL